VALFREPLGLLVMPAANWQAVFLPFFILLTYHNETNVDMHTLNLVLCF
jgi:hypothetical protein